MNWTPGKPYDWGSDFAAVGAAAVLGGIGLATGLAVKFPYLFGALFLASPTVLRHVLRKKKKL